MAQLRDDQSKFEDLDTTIIILGPENARAFRTYWQANQLSFIGLPDPNHQVLKLYGQEVNLFKLGRMPAMVIVDKKGLARYAHYGHEMSDIPPNGEVLKTLYDLNQEKNSQ